MAVPQPGGAAVLVLGAVAAAQPAVWGRPTVLVLLEVPLEAEALVLLEVPPEALVLLEVPLEAEAESFLLVPLHKTVLAELASK